MKIINTKLKAIGNYFIELMDFDILNDSIMGCFLFEYLQYGS